MLDVISVDDVFRVINEHFSNYILNSETIGLDAACGRILAEDIAAPRDVPGFHRSAVDGYAVIASDTFGASDSLPAQLWRVGEIHMGEKPGFALQKGQAAYVPTGGELPANADAVVMIEYVEDLHDGFVYIQKSAAPGNHIIFRGDDVRAGQVALMANTLLRPQEIGALASMGCRWIKVKRKLQVGIISTGDEIIPIDREPTGAQIRDVNAHVLYAGLIAMGAQPRMYGISGDDFDSMKQLVETALKESDAVLVSGGSSAGTRDETGRVIDSLGNPGLLFHGIAVKPGKPTILGKVEEKPVFGLPGHPVSNYMIFHIFVRRLVDTLSGISPKPMMPLKAEMACNYPSNQGREEFLPVRLENIQGRLTALPLFGKSGLITMLTGADGYIHIHRGTEGLPKGALQEVYLF